MARENRRRRRRSPGKDWSAVSVGIVTMATIIAAATVAAAINISRETSGLADANQGDAPLAGIAAFLSALSLGAYLVATFTGLWSLFRKPASEQEPLVKMAAAGLYAQIFAAVIFAFLAILGPLITGI